MSQLCSLPSLSSSNDPRPAAVRIELHMHTIPHEHLDAMQTHFAGKISECDITGRKLYAKKRIGERLLDNSFYNLWFSHICVGG